ncbi:hypothetical protein BHM03_00016395 [Ensete ventricosum]|nr:hypothetical protein BHM03_00016395 [Ensete ventricosum]
MGDETRSKFKRICVFCGSNSGNRTVFSDAALDLGRELVCPRWSLPSKKSNFEGLSSLKVRRSSALVVHYSRYLFFLLAEPSPPLMHASDTEKIPAFWNFYILLFCTKKLLRNRAGRFPI